MLDQGVFETGIFALHLSEERDVLSERVSAIVLLDVYIATSDADHAVFTGHRDFLDVDPQ